MDIPILCTLLQVLLESKRQLLCCAAPDAVVRLQHTQLSDQEQQTVLKEYWDDQKHNSLFDFLQHCIMGKDDCVLSQVIYTIIVSHTYAKFENNLVLLCFDCQFGFAGVFPHHKPYLRK